MTLPDDIWQRETYYLKGNTMTQPKITKAEADELTAQHTEEPWYYTGVSELPRVRARHTINEAPEPLIADCKNGWLPEGQAEANAKRIAACVNACKDMTDPGAEIAQLRQDKADLVAVLENIQEHSVSLTDDGVCTECEHMTKLAKAAIAKGDKV